MTGGNHAGDSPAGAGTDGRAGATRRQVLGALGTGALGIAGITGVTAAQRTPVVSMANDYFDPIGLSVEPGTTVRFDVATGSHSATAYEDRIPTAAAPFDSGVRSAGAFEHTFDEPGTYDYYCIPHEANGMVGRIVVGEPGGPAEEGSIPAGSVPDSETILEQGAVPFDEFDGADGGSNRRRMGPGMMGGGGPWWMALVPVGLVSALLASVVAIGYWASRKGPARASTEGPAIETLRRQYARGEFDEEEFRERRQRLREEE